MDRAPRLRYFSRLSAAMKSMKVLTLAERYLRLG